MENDKYRKRTTKQPLINVATPFKKGASVIGATVMLTSAVIPGFMVVEADEINEPGANTLNLPSWSSLSKNMARNSFVELIGEQARDVAAANDLYASVMTAQAILESGWGASWLSQAPHYNLFGIKWSGNGLYSEWSTKEVLNGKWVTIIDKFQKYASYTESLQANASLLKNRVFQSGNHFYSGTWKSNTTSYGEATAWLAGRYATDPGYASKLNAIIISQNLTRFDTPGNGSQRVETAETGQTASSYTVVAGDSLFSIARKHSTTVATLKSSNNLTDTSIYVGQKLAVGTSTETTSGGLTQTVASGETLSSISRKHGISVANLKALNHLSSDTISVGQTLQINEAGTSPASTSSSHTVGRGDTLYSIAKKYGVDVTSLKAWNKLSSDGISDGQTLTVNGAGASSSDSLTSPSHTVAAGETLYSVARQYGVGVADLSAWNNLSDNSISVGQLLVVQSDKQVSSAITQTYKVMSGDTLWSIANKHNVTVKQIISWNNVKNETVSIGQNLRVT